VVAAILMIQNASVTSGTLLVRVRSIVFMHHLWPMLSHGKAGNYAAVQNRPGEAN